MTGKSLRGGRILEEAEHERYVMMMLLLRYVVMLLAYVVCPSVPLSLCGGGVSAPLSVWGVCLCPSLSVPLSVVGTRGT